MPASRPYPEYHRRATRIIATVGPASHRPAILRRLVAAGVDLFRFNMSHGTHAEHAARMESVRTVARETGRSVGILVDLQGPKLRTGWNEGGAPIPLRRGSRVTLEFRPEPPGAPARRSARRAAGLSRPDRLVISPPALGRALAPGDELLLDDGRLRLVVERARSGRTVARVVRGGMLKQHAGVNLIGRATTLRAPTPKDRRDAAFAVAQGADFVALSFVQQASDLRRLRGLLSRLAGANLAGPSSTKAGRSARDRAIEAADRRRAPLIIAKLEKPSALADLEAILDETDGVMVARGDLGVELSLEEVPLWQKEILHRARLKGVFTITATQMLESMIHAAVPTRAEVSDVANAVLDGTGALMLSAESAAGSYPVESVRMLASIATHADRIWLQGTGHDLEDPSEPANPAAERRAPIDAVARAAVEMAVRSHARWIVAFTMSGETIRHLTRHRCPVPILALTPSEATCRRLALAWNTRAIRIAPTRTTDELMQKGVDTLRRLRLARAGDLLVLAAGTVHPPGATNLLRLTEVPRR